MEIQNKVDLKNYTTYRVGGVADYFCVACSSSDLRKAIGYAKENKLPFIVIGNGSNLLVADTGYRGLIIKNEIDFMEFKENSVSVGSGHSLIAMSQELSKKGFTGFEGLCGIPGTVGGAVSINAGAWGQNISDTLEQITVLDTEALQEEKIKKSELEFGYRKSSIDPASKIIISAEFNLKPGDLAGIEKQIKENQEKRNSIQPKGFSCGSFFKNPEGDSAGRLIDSLGLKGKKLGGAEVSSVHANFIINSGNATAADVKKLSEEIKAAVYAKYQIDLIEEVKLIGEFK